MRKYWMACARRKKVKRMGRSCKSEVSHVRPNPEQVKQNIFPVKLRPFRKEPARISGRAPKPPPLARLCPQQRHHIHGAVGLSCCPSHVPRFRRVSALNKARIHPRLNSSSLTSRTCTVHILRYRVPGPVDHDQSCFRVRHALVSRVQILLVWSSAMGRQ